MFKAARITSTKNYSPESFLDRLTTSLALCIFLASINAANASNPVAFDVFSSAPRSTANEPFSTQIIFDAQDSGGDDLSYSIQSQPAHGTLSAVQGDTVS
ncbi:MAG: hypothetical protein AAF098_18400 [Pseudomonadota bacterium]